MLASDPTHYGGGLTADASDKLARFVDLCDQFHLPVVNFVDQPGFVVGTEAEQAGTIRRGTRALVAVYQATVPWGSVLVRKVYGIAGAGARRRAAAQPALRVALGQLGLAADRRRAGGGLPARARGGRDPVALRAEIEARLNAVRSPFRTAERFSSRRSSTRATPGRCSATGPSARTSWSRTSWAPARRRAACGP